MRKKDAEDSTRIRDEIYRRRDEEKGPICGECLLPIVNTRADGSWVHADETPESARHTMVPIV